MIVESPSHPSGNALLPPADVQGGETDMANEPKDGISETPGTGAGVKNFASSIITTTNCSLSSTRLITLGFRFVIIALHAFFLRTVLLCVLVWPHERKPLRHNHQNGEPFRGSWRCSVNCFSHSSWSRVRASAGWGALPLRAAWLSGRGKYRYDGGSSANIVHQKTRLPPCFVDKSA